MTDRRIREKIIKTTIHYCHIGTLTILGLACVLCFSNGKTLCFFIVKVKSTVLLLCVCVHSA